MNQAPNAPEIQQSPLPMEAQLSPFSTQTSNPTPSQNTAPTPRSNKPQKLEIPSALPKSLPKGDVEAQVADFINRTHKARRGQAVEESPATLPEQAPEGSEAPQEEPSELAEYLNSPEEALPEEEKQVSEESAAPTVKEVDFRQFAFDNPDVIFKYPNKNAPGGYAQMTAKKAADFFANAAQLDQMAYNIKVKKAEIAEFENTKKQEFDNLLIGLETVIAPQITGAVATMKKAYEYNDQWREWASKNPDPASQAKAEAEIEKNESIIANQAQFIETTRPKAAQFAKIKEEQVKEELDKLRKSFKNPQLRNEVVYEKLTSDLQKEWSGSQRSLYPGIRNLDLVRSDEELLSLIADGLKFRSGPKIQRQAGQSLSGNSSKARSVRAPSDPSAELQTRAQKGDKAAAADVISMWINSQNRQKRG